MAPCLYLARSDAADLLHRTLGGADLEVRADGRTVFGLAVPFDQEATVNDGLGPYREVFRLGAFAKTVAERGTRVKLLVNHDRMRLPIGKAVNLREDSAGLVGEFHVSKTPEGDQALELIRDGVLDAFSVGFSPVPGKSRSRNGLTERLEVKLREVSVVAFPAYEGAAIAGVRTEDTDPSTPTDEAALGTSDEGAANSDEAAATRRLEVIAVADLLWRVGQSLKEKK